MKTITIYRIENPETHHGMWYDANGQYDPVIQEDDDYEEKIDPDEITEEKGYCLERDLRKNKVTYMRKIESYLLDDPF